jgi:hypothetical protein
MLKLLVWLWRKNNEPVMSAARREARSTAPPAQELPSPDWTLSA